MINKIKVYEPISSAMLAIVNGINKLIDAFNQGGGSVPRDLEVDSITVKGNNDDDLHIFYYPQVESQDIATSGILRIESDATYITSTSIFCISVVQGGQETPAIYAAGDGIILDAINSLCIADTYTKEYFKRIMMEFTFPSGKTEIEYYNITKATLCSYLHITAEQFKYVWCKNDFLQLRINNCDIEVDKISYSKRNNYYYRVYTFSDIHNSVTYTMKITQDIDYPDKWTLNFKQTPGI